MSTETIRRCDVCGSPMAERSRRFVTNQITLIGLNGEAKRETLAPMDFCSSQCILAAVNDLIRKVS